MKATSPDKKVAFRVFCVGDGRGSIAVDKMPGASGVSAVVEIETDAEC